MTSQQLARLVAGSTSNIGQNYRNPNTPNILVAHPDTGQVMYAPMAPAGSQPGDTVSTAANTAQLFANSLSGITILPGNGSKFTGTNPDSTQLSYTFGVANASTNYVVMGNPVWYQGTEGYSGPVSASDGSVTPGAKLNALLSAGKSIRITQIQYSVAVVASAQAQFAARFSAVQGTVTVENREKPIFAQFGVNPQNYQNNLLSFSCDLTIGYANLIVLNVTNMGASGGSAVTLNFVYSIIS